MNPIHILLDTYESETSDVWRPTWNLTRMELAGYSNFIITPTNFAIPNAVYPINKYYNRIYLTEDEVTVLEGTLSERMYDGFEFADEIQAVLNVMGANTYTVSYDDATFKINITATGNFALVDGDFACYERAGLDPSTFTYSAETSGTNPVNLGGTKSVHLISSMGGNQFRVGTGESVFAVIPMNGEFGSEIHYSYDMPMPIKVGDISVNNFTFELRDDHNFPYELPANQHWSMLLTVHPVTQQNNAPKFVFDYEMRR